MISCKYCSHYRVCAYKDQTKAFVDDMISKSCEVQKPENIEIKYECCYFKQSNPIEEMLNDIPFMRHTKDEMGVNISDD